jgi:NADPH:quinone reductase-like Zn-dependent oxidoreductase
LVFDIFGGDIANQSAGLIRSGGTLVTVAGPVEASPANGSTIDFVVEANRDQLTEIVQRLREGRLRANIGNIATLNEAVDAFLPANKGKGKTIIRVHA